MADIRIESFGKTEAGRAVTRYTMENGAGMRVSVLDYGSTVQSIVVPDRAGVPTEVALGYDDIAGYEAGSCYLGALPGRYANRIAGGRFTLGGRTYELSQNDGANHLHGAWSTALFEAGREGDVLVMRHVSTPEEEGYPGTVDFTARYALGEDNALSIVYEAETDADTVLNPTCHAYFNLNGGGDVLGHALRLHASAFCEGGAGTLPTGRILPVEGTPMDFRAFKAIGRDIGADDAQLIMCRGYDHNYVLDGPEGTLRLCAEVVGDRTGITLACLTTQPGMQLYTGNFLDGDTAPFGRGGERYPRYGGFCLETQHFPDSPNRPAFPSTVLRAGECFRHETVYRFGTTAGKGGAEA